MSKTQLPTTDEIQAVYRQGDGVTVALFEQLIGAIQALEARIEELKNQHAKDSHNSNKPPTSDGLIKKPKSLRHKSGKKSGGQAGGNLARKGDPTGIGSPEASCVLCSVIWV